MSKLCLGTVNFGMPYGPKNYQVPEKECYEILDYALDNGIDAIDTAKAYGYAESLLKKYKIKDEKALITTKFLPNYTNKIIYQIKDSRDKLGHPIFLLHSEDQIYDGEILNIIAKNTYVLGASVYRLRNGLDAIDKVKFIQFPYSIFDQSFDNNRFWRRINNNNIITYARSAFLQGRLVSGDGVPEDKMQKLDLIIKKHKFDRKEAAFLFSLTNPNIDFTVFGVSNVEQLKENIALYQDKEKWEKFMPCREELVNEFNDMSIQIPSLWRKA